MSELIVISKQDLTDLLNDLLDQKLKQYTTPRENIYLSKKEVASRFKISLGTVNNRLRDGTFKSHNVGGRILLVLQEVEAALTS